MRGGLAGGTKIAGCGSVGARWALVGVFYQVLQVSLSGIEYLRVRVSHVLRVVQVGDGEVDSKRHQERNCSCSGGDSKMSQAWSGGRR